MKITSTATGIRATDHGYRAGLRMRASGVAFIPAALATSATAKPAAAKAAGNAWASFDPWVVSLM